MKNTIDYNNYHDMTTNQQSKVDELILQGHKFVGIFEKRLNNRFYKIAVLELNGVITGVNTRGGTGGFTAILAKQTKY